MKKIGLIADIHGHLAAAESVVTDAQQCGVEEFWFLGDLLLPGVGSSELIMLLKDANTTAFVKGNWDSQFESLSNLASVDLDDPEMVYQYYLTHFQKNIITEEEFLMMRDLPLCITKEIYGLKVQLTHSLPWKNYADDLTQDKPQENFDQLLKNSTCDIAVYGHIHSQLMRMTSDGRMVINPGAVVSCKDKKSEYAILTVETDQTWSVEFRKVRHDVEREIQTARKLSLPYLELYEQTLKTGKEFKRDVKSLKNVADKFGYRDTLMKEIINGE